MSRHKVPDSKYTIENAWREHFAPAARDLGFKGSGRHFRRIVGDYVHTINLQGSQWGGKFAVNLGLQPMLIPAELDREFDPKTIKEIDCRFRDRLTYDGHDTWWSYNEDEQSRIVAAKSAAKLLREKVDDHFNERTQFIENVTPEELGQAMPGYFVALALVREKQGKIDQAKQFAENATERGSSKYWKGYSPIKHLLS